MLKDSFTTNLVEAGCDEVGCGCLAGPVVAAAVILPKRYKHHTLNDSKQLTPKVRMALRQDIERDAISWGIAEVNNREIDTMNILNASFKAMHLALDRLTVLPHLLLIDGNRFQAYKKINFQCIVGGDASYLSIAAASVLAKTYRDELMVKLSKKYTVYGWERNMGYPTKKHRESIKKWGITPLHRTSFRMPLQEYTP